MPEQRLHSALAPIDILTRKEIEEVFHSQMDNFVREWYRGEDYVEYNGVGLNGAAAAQFTIPGPDSGYTWSVKLLSVLANAAATVSVFLGDNIVTAPVAVASLAAAGPAIFEWSSNQLPLKDNRVLTVSAASVATNYPVPSQPAVPASGTAVQNANTYPVNVTLSGFTATAVTVNGVQVGTGNGTYLVPSGGSIAVTYSIAGTWSWVNANGTSSTTTPTLAQWKIIAKQVPSEMVGKL